MTYEEFLVAMMLGLIGFTALPAEDFIGGKI